MDHECKHEKDWGRLNGHLPAIEARLERLEESVNKIYSEQLKAVIAMASFTQSQKDRPTIRQQAFFASIGGGLVVFGGLLIKFLWDKI
jgi:molybdopterin biosynthesis enzyme